ncbi:pilus assembly protein [Variovorax sp. PvP013]|uniref:pilus assembly protein n=1 Tax=Variovorax sp. PvP013 TaxID=3156435 RepID=UPI003D248766
MKNPPRHIVVRWVPPLALLLASVASWLAFGQSADVRQVELSAEPLYAGAGGQRPTLTLALSVEYPTVGAQYLNPVYDAGDTYVGYFDAASCYAYVDDTDAALRRFDRIGAAVSHGCRGAGFSGNFMNWATSSAIDVLRLGLTGGDRIVDTPEMTVLQRAVLYAPFDGNFARKRLARAAAADAVPRALLGDWDGDVFIGNCLDRVEFGTVGTGSCTTPGDNADLGVGLPALDGTSTTAHGSTRLSSDRFFYARVRVCETDGARALTDPRAGLCALQPAGNFKPVGNLQKYADRLRVAAFGYLLDPSNARYGGVLRAPMKFVGATSRDAAGVRQPSNPHVEWDPSTGVFVANPDGAAEGVSGVVNYLNRFGRTGAVPGMYKRYDPVSELYYEALRYLQGLPPTPQATAGMTDAMKDGFPVHDRWDDPHAGGSATRDQSCLRNNILVIGDIHTHKDASIPGRASTDPEEFARPADPSGNEPDFAAWTRVVGGFESDTRVPYPGDPAHASANPNPAGSPRSPIADLATIGPGYDIAGMAYWARTHDIRGTSWTAEPARQRPGMRVTTYVLDVNEYGDSTRLDDRRRNQFFLAAKYGGFQDRSGTGSPFVGEKGGLDNGAWESAAGQGDPRTYYLASSAGDVLKGLDEIFASLASRSDTIAAGDAPTAALTAGETASVYRTSFDSDGWRGDLLALPLALDTTGRVQAGSTRAEARWSAAERLDAPTLDPDRRRIFIGRVDASERTADEFRWALLEDGGADRPKALLDRIDAATPPDALGSQRVDFLRGDRSLEGIRFRRRTSRLGDFVNSGVAFSGAPTARHGSTSYVAFHDRHAGRRKAVFAGANDGMLHAFDADTGDELFGYIPSWMGPQLATLTSPAYDAGLHRAYVDATPRVAEAETADGGWKTVLAGGTGGGGQGVYALDVSDPAAFDASKVLWEFTDRDDPALGNVIGRPQILKFRTSAVAATGAPTYRTYVVVAGGVDNARPDGRASADGAPAIFLLDLSKPVGTPWRLGANYFRLSVPVDAALARTVAPGIVDFNPVIGRAGEVESLYFGDLHGRLWKLDFSRKGSADWTMPALSAFARNGAALPLFVARDAGDGSAAGRPQPIGTAPRLIAGPDRSILVAFGTGKYLEADDNQSAGSAQRQSVYVLYDDASAAVDGGDGGAIAGRSRLAAGVARGGAVTVPAFAWGRPGKDDDPTRRAGWYVDLPAAGERQVSDMATFGDTLVFASLVPPAATGDVCGGGSGNVYQVSLVTGEGRSMASTVGVPGTPMVLRSGPSVHGPVDGTGRGTTTTRGRVVARGSGGNDALGSTAAGDFGSLTRTSVFGTLSWRRIPNYQALHHARD